MASGGRQCWATGLTISGLPHHDPCWNSEGLDLCLELFRATKTHCRRSSDDWTHRLGLRADPMAELRLFPRERGVARSSCEVGGAVGRRTQSFGQGFLGSDPGRRRLVHLQGGLTLSNPVETKHECVPSAAAGRPSKCPLPTCHIAPRRTRRARVSKSLNDCSNIISIGHMFGRSARIGSGMVPKVVRCIGPLSDTCGRSRLTFGPAKLRQNPFERVCNRPRNQLWRPRALICSAIVQLASGVLCGGVQLAGVFRAFVRTTCCAMGTHFFGMSCALFTDMTPNRGVCRIVFVHKSRHGGCRRPLVGSQALGPRSLCTTEVAPAGCPPRSKVSAAEHLAVEEAATVIAPEGS